ncbi:MAG: methyltransferase domain-containing protein [Alphaproteobacteria bacterium]|nr:methyltransferase domain-containing protein [Alphaproteobacteria bacterium]
MESQKLKELDRVFRQHGIEAEDTFKVISAYYLNVHKPSDVSSLLEQFWIEGNSILERITNDNIAIQTLEYTVAFDYYGECLPIIYQFFLGKRFRDLSGKFFTPKNLAKFMVKMLPIKSNVSIMDPTCGGGTFLIEASKRWNNCSCRLIGNDVDRMLVALSETLILINKNPNHNAVFFNDNIFDVPKAQKQFFETIDYIIANPPFSLPIESFEVTSNLFKLGYRNSDALFIDLCWKYLKPSGLLVCLLPHSIITNKEYEKLRLEIEKFWEIAAIIVMPEGVFNTTSNTTTRADIVFLRKQSDLKNVSRIVFANISDIKHLNYDTNLFIEHYSELSNIISDFETNYVKN